VRVLLARLERWPETRIMRIPELWDALFTRQASKTQVFGAGHIPNQLEKFSRLIFMRLRK
jgi:hypothetical protein